MLKPLSLYLSLLIALRRGHAPTRLGSPWNRPLTKGVAVHDGATNAGAPSPDRAEGACLLRLSSWPNNQCMYQTGFNI